MPEWDLFFVQAAEECDYSLIILVVATEHNEILKSRGRVYC